jgi:hypothetical protein
MNLKEFLMEAGGEAAGTKEVAQTTLKKAIKFFTKQMKKIGMDLYEEIPNFDKNYKKLRKLVKNHGEEHRKDMPVVSWKQVKEFQKSLHNGDLDIQNPFNENKLMEIKMEGDSNKVKAVFKSIKAKDLKPVQEQIYLSKVIKNFKKYGVPHDTHFITTKYMIVDKNNRIIDGHHRWTTVMIADPNIKIDLLKVDLDMEKLLPLTKAYGISRGNKQNS